MDGIADSRSDRNSRKPLCLPQDNVGPRFSEQAIPERHLKFRSDIDALRKLPNYLVLRKFSDKYSTSRFEYRFTQLRNPEGVQELQRRLGLERHRKQRKPGRRVRSIKRG